MLGEVEGCGCGWLEVKLEVRVMSCVCNTYIYFRVVSNYVLN